MIINIIILVILIFISSICSMMETALSSSNIIRIKSISKRKGKESKKAKKAYYLIKNYSKTLTTILIYNNIVNIAAASLTTYLFSSKLGSTGIIYATVLTTVLILVFGEITPKILAKEHAEKILLRLCSVFTILVTIMMPITILVEWFERLFKKNKKVTATEEELLEIVQTIEYEGILNQGERELIQNAVEFDDKRVKDVMINRKDVVFLYDTSTQEALKNLIINKKYSRIPIVCEKTDKVIGVIHEGDVIDNVLSGKSISIKSLMKPILYMTKNRRLSHALEKIQKNRMHMAIVVDNNEDHNFLGIVTLEDILEELVGEIYDEYDDLPKNVLRIGLHTYHIDPNISVSSFFDEYIENTRAPQIKSKTFIGWINEISNKSKYKLNEEFVYENIRIKIIDVDDDMPNRLEIIVSSTYEELI